MKKSLVSTNCSLFLSLQTLRRTYLVRVKIIQCVPSNNFALRLRWTKQNPCQNDLPKCKHLTRNLKDFILPTHSTAWISEAKILYLWMKKIEVNWRVTYNYKSNYVMFCWPCTGLFFIYVYLYSLRVLGSNVTIIRRIIVSMGDLV